MNPVQLIARKRDGDELTTDEISSLIAGYVAGTVPDYQMSAFAMAVLFQGMTDAETASLTRSMLNSGVTLSWPSGLPVVDKHSTGGIGDKVSIILAPMLAACGLYVPMLSGRGLGPTGGTLDKLESIAGLRTNLSLHEFQRVVLDVGCAITGTTSEIVPADRKLYALRDVTGTVPSIPLITASIMSKKLAESLRSLVLDVKWGSGAFMQTQAEAESLAKSMVRAGELLGTRTTAVITDMNQPLGRLCGNSVEISESIACLQGGGPADLLEVTLQLGCELVRSITNDSIEGARSRLQATLDSGKAYEFFERMMQAQGGDLNASLERAPEFVLTSERAGFISKIDVAALGYLIIDLGGGRRALTDRIDHGVGFEILVRIGDEIQSGQPLFRVFARSLNPELRHRFLEAIVIGEQRPELPNLICSKL